MSAGASHFHYNKVACPWCGRWIATNTLGRHQAACPKKPISEMTLGEMVKRGVTSEEFDKAMKGKE